MLRPDPRKDKASGAAGSVGEAGVGVGIDEKNGNAHGRVTRIKTDLIVRPESARQIDRKTVEMLKQSIGTIGLLQPITVKPHNLHRGVMVDGYQLISGGHRLTAVDELGWGEIDATVVSDTLKYLECELIEIDENLCRSDLTASQRAKATKRRKDIWESLHPNSGTSCPEIRERGRPSEFASETAAISGQSKKDINRHLSRATKLGSDLDAVAGTSLDTGVELDALKKLTPEQRAPLIAKAKTGAVVTARKPPIEPDQEPEDDLLAEYEREVAENRALQERLDTLTKNDTVAELDKWVQKFHQLEGRLNQAIATGNEGAKQAQRQGKLLKQIREHLNVERDSEILPKLKGGAK
jgi:hypothetical protein